MLVQDVMTRGVEGVQSQDTVLHAAVRMKELDIGSLAVFDNSRLVGIITDRDVAVRVVGNSLNPVHTSVGEIMSKEPVSCNETSELSEAAHIMENYKIRRLLVKDSTGEICGIINVDDIALRGEEVLAVEVLKNVKDHFGPRR